MNTLNIAHRGFSGYYPENTMIAFRKAVEAGCDGIELDIQLTCDGVPVICHDEEVNRTTDGKGMLFDYKFSELSKLDAGKWKGVEFVGERIPTLEELFDYTKDKNILINLELKNSVIHYNRIEEKVLKMISDFKMQENIIISSFNHYSLKKVKYLNSTIKTGILYECCMINPWEYATGIGVDAIHPWFYSLDEEIINASHDNNIKINTYTVNEEKDMMDLIDMGVDSIITNYPDKLKKVNS